MKKEYKAPLTEEIECIEHYGLMDVDHSGGEIGDDPDDYESKSATFEAEDLNSEPLKSVNLWEDEDNQKK